MIYLRLFIGVLCVGIWAGSISAQTFIYIKDDKGNVINGAHVFIHPFNHTRPVYEISDFQGRVKVNLQTVSQLKISHVGYATLVDTIQPGTDLSFILHEDPAQLNEFVVTSYAVPTRIQESVYKIRIIDRIRIEALGAQHLRDVLTNDLNMRLSQDAILGTGVNMQGVGGENVKIMVDGVPLIGRLPDLQ